MSLIIQLSRLYHLYSLDPFFFSVLIHTHVFHFASCYSLLFSPVQAFLYTPMTDHNVIQEYYYPWVFLPDFGHRQTWAVIR